MVLAVSETVSYLPAKYLYGSLTQTLGLYEVKTFSIVARRTIDPYNSSIRTNKGVLVAIVNSEN